MKRAAGLFFPGLSLLLVLLSCGGRVQADGQAGSLGSAALNGTNHTATTPKPEVTVAVLAQNGTQSTVAPAEPSNTTASDTTTAHTTATTPKIISTTTVNTPAAETNTTEAPPTSPNSPNVTTGTPKAPSSASTTAETATAKGASNLSRSSGFDVGSFIGGIVLTLGLLIIGYIGCRTYHAKRGVQYRTIDEHDAII